MNFIYRFWLQRLMHSFLGLGAGPLAGTAKNLFNSANTAAGTYGSAAGSEGAQLNPFYTQEMKATHEFNPNQMNEMLTAAEAGGGGATGALTGQAALEDARTHNASGFTKSLDELARDKSKTAAGASEGIAAQDVMGAKQLNQAGAQGMQGLYGTNVGAQLKAMGQANEDLNTEMKADQQAPSWLQSLTNLASGTNALGQMGMDATKIPGVNF